LETKDWEVLNPEQHESLRQFCAKAYL